MTPLICLLDLVTKNYEKNAPNGTPPKLYQTIKMAHL